MPENWNFKPPAFASFLLGVFLPLQIFAGLAVAIAQQGSGLPWDVPLLSAIHDTAQPNLDVFADILTQFGYVKGVIPAVLLIALGLAFRQQWYRLTYLLLNAFGALLLCYQTKLTFHRARPHLWELLHRLPSDYSFPSGHACLSLMLPISLVYLSWGSRWCKWVMMVGGLFAVGIGWTRLYLGVHYPSDVLGGWMLAIAWSRVVHLSLKFSLSQLIAKKQESA